jgi:hypothetical protein
MQHVLRQLAVQEAAASGPLARIRPQSVSGRRRRAGDGGRRAHALIIISAHAADGRQGWIRALAGGCAAGCWLAAAGAGRRLVVAGPAADAGRAERSNCRSSRAPRRATSPRPGSTPACRPIARTAVRSGSAGRGRRAASAPAATRSTPAPRRAACWTSWCRARDAADRAPDRGLDPAPGARGAGRPHLKPTTAGLDDARLMQAWALPACLPKGASSRHLCLQPRRQRPDGAARAHRAMQQRLAAGLGRPRRRHAAEVADEALILASIVEKETGRPPTAAWWRRCSSTGCASACRCRPTRP